MVWICTSQEWDDSLNKSQVLEGRNTAERLCRHQWKGWGPHVAILGGVYVTFRSAFATQNTKNKTKNHRNPPISSIALRMKSKIWQDRSSGLFSLSRFTSCHNLSMVLKPNNLPSATEPCECCWLCLQCLLHPTQVTCYSRFCQL